MRNPAAKSHRHAASWLLLASVLTGVLVNAVYAQDATDGTGAAETASAQQSADEELIIRPIRTDSPRSTLLTFLRLRDELEENLLAYRANKTRALADQIEVIGSQLQALLDLSAVPKASRREVGGETIAVLLDILGRVELPNLDSVPDADAFDDDVSPAKWRIPGTPIRIVRAEGGPRQGEFLFSERTAQVAPRFFKGIENLPLRSALAIDSWSRAILQITGPMIPAGLLTAMPDGLKDLWLGTPKWKVLAVVLVTVVSAFVLLLLHRAINRDDTDSRTGFLLRRALTPILILAVVWMLKRFIGFEINIAGLFSTIVDVVTTVAVHAAAVWLFWVLVLAVFERIIVSRDLPEQSFDAHLWRLGARTIGIAGSVVIIGNAAQDLGLPLYSLLAGLGIGGLAVALAIRPTLENLIGGIILYLDRPVRVGDFCTFGDKTGTVESIGVRSTKLRATDRTLITVPNAALADMQLINWARCDRMLISTTIGLRYETENDQLRYVLVKCREMFHAHPKIHGETVRVRFAGFGASSLDIGVRVYALTHDWNEFHAIREDVFLRISDIVKASGTGFAFPSQTLYMSRDEGLDTERGESAANEIQSLRRAGKLPFPRLAAERIEQLEDTLDYPPRGSVEAGSPELQEWETSESLSAEPDDEVEDEDELKRSSKLNVDE